MLAVPARNRGFTLIELVIVIVIISVLATVALRRLTAYQELAEKTAMESTLSIIKTGLQIRLAELIIANRQNQAKQLETSNPMQWLVEPPANYRGIYRRPAERGNWYFDDRRCELVYVVNNGEFLTTETTDDERQLRFRVELLNGYVETARAKVKTVTGITLVPVYPYRWP